LQRSIGKLMHGNFVKEIAFIKKGGIQDVHLKKIICLIYLSCDVNKRSDY
jgi:hypothetical protein